MQLLALPTSLLRTGDDLVAALLQNELQDDDIIAVSSKVVATVEGTIIDLATMMPTDDAKRWAEKTKSLPAFLQAVIQETERMHGRILGAAPSALLTELKPHGLRVGRLLVPNAGLDRSNIEEGFAVGWPLDPVRSTTMLRSELEKRSGKRLAVVLTDSCCHATRLGVTAFALCVSNLPPLLSQLGHTDLYGRPFAVTQEAIADQIATAANMVMGNAAQSTPAAVLRDHGFTLATYEGWVQGMEPRDDLFADIFH